MPFPPKRDHNISRADAVALTRRHRESAGKGAQLATLFPRDVYERILAQPGCAGIRAYEGRDEKGERQTILVGVDAEGNDMTGGVLAEFTLPCPPYCGGGGGDGEGLAG
ncbi:hypothetical protein BH23GEM2_BH23GEM2_23100 [soil metagenome]